MPPRLPNPHRSISPTVQGMGRTWRKGRRGMGDACILQPETGEKRMPLRLPNPHRSISPTVQGMGENLKRELAQGFILPGTAFPRVSP